MGVWNYSFLVLSEYGTHSEEINDISKRLMEIAQINNVLILGHC